MTEHHHRYTGTISISPPLTRAQIQHVDSGAHGRLDSIKLCAAVPRPRHAAGTTPAEVSADAVAPAAYQFPGDRMAEQLQALVDAFPDHTFTGHIEVHWDPTYRALPSRLTVRGRIIERIDAFYAWPDELPRLKATASFQWGSRIRHGEICKIASAQDEGQALALVRSEQFPEYDGVVRRPVWLGDWEDVPDPAANAAETEITP